VLPLLVVLAELSTLSPTAAEMCNLLQAIQRCTLLLPELPTDEHLLEAALAAQLVQVLLQRTGSAVQHLLQQPCNGDSSMLVEVVAQFTKLWQLLSVMGEFCENGSWFAVTQRRCAMHCMHLMCSSTHVRLQQKYVPQYLYGSSVRGIILAPYRHAPKEMLECTGATTARPWVVCIASSTSGAMYFVQMSLAN
jgi:hypothetical protein